MIIGFVLREIYWSIGLGVGLGLVLCGVSWGLFFTSMRTVLYDLPCGHGHDTECDHARDALRRLDDNAGVWIPRVGFEFWEMSSFSSECLEFV